MLEIHSVDSYQLFSYIFLKNLLFFLVALSGTSQEKNYFLKSDTLQNKTYEQLNNLSDNAIQSNNSISLSAYRNYHLKKAKNENNHLEIARAYYSFITWENLNKDLAYCDSIIDITKNSDYRAYPTNGYLLKAQLYYKNSDFVKALDNYIIANDWAIKKQFEPLQIESVLGIAAIKNVWGQHEEALGMYRSNYFEIIQSPNYMDDLYFEYIELARNFSLSLIRNNEPDSALFIVKNAMKNAHEAQDLISYYDLGKVHATANFYLKKYPNTLDSLLKFSPKYSDIVLADSYYMMAKIYQYKNNHLLAEKYFKKIDSIHQSLGDPFPELKDVYNELYKYSKKRGENEKQLYYLNQLLAVDSILDLNYNSVNEKMRLDYDIPQFKKVKANLTRKLAMKEQQLWLYIVLSILIISILLFIYFKRQQKLKGRLHKLLQTDVIENTEVIFKDTKTSSIEMSKDTINDILEQLSSFEKSKGYLSKDITLHSLAKEFNTNSSYLSSIINQVKQINFATYLKNMRIINAINEIKKNRELLKYSMNGLADEFGFSTAESFSKAFREKTGVKPSYFLDELRKEKM
ncbi:helix-turn-helix domain-containing protein [Yeosuana sp. AK3]